MPENELKPALTHSELCLIAERFLRNNGFSVAFHDRFVAAVSTGEQPDAIGFRNLASCLIEAKCSRGDFLADRKSGSAFNLSSAWGLALLHLRAWADPH